MHTTRVSTKGQIVLPKEIRESLGLEPGTLLQVTLDGQRAILEPLGISPRKRLYGKYRNVKLLEALEADHGKEIAAEAGS